jgi:hypothetical protein
VSGGEAVTWEDKTDEIFPGAHARIVETLEQPNSISAGASSQQTPDGPRPLYRDAPFGAERYSTFADLPSKKLKLTASNV